MKPKKSLGQNFLKNTGIALSVARAGEASAGDMVVEIGPGKGVLTQELLSFGARVIAIEKDRELLPILEEKFSDEIREGKLVLVSGDALSFAPEEYGLESLSWKLIANIPYYITGEIFRHFLSLSHPPSLLSLLVQKEVAERVVARGGKESILSLSVKAYGEPKYEQTVKAENFSPKPKVDSAILSVKNIHAFPDSEHFFEIIKLGFSQKRKKLASNLGRVFGKESVEKGFLFCEMGANARAEDVSLEKWKCIAKSLK